MAIAVVGGLVVALLHRNPESAGSDGVDQFQRIMDALAPDDEDHPTPPDGAVGHNER